MASCLWGYGLQGYPEKWNVIDRGGDPIGHAHQKKARNKLLQTIRCPACRALVAYEVNGDHSEITIVDNDEYWPSVMYLDCWRCKARLGIRKTEYQTILFTSDRAERGRK